MNAKYIEKTYKVTLYRIYETAKNTTTSIEAAQQLGIPYKTFVRIAKEMNIFKDAPKLQEETPLEEIIKGLHPNYGSTRLKQRLIDAKILEWKCSIIECGVSEWMGKPITLELDHINGNNSDHRIENLRMLCPNCHSQTSTHRFKKRPSEEIGKA